MLTLNNTRTGISLPPSFGSVCMIAQAQAIRMDSVALSVITDISRNGRFTDMFPVTPGMVTFIREVPTAASSRADASQGCQPCPCRTASPMVPAAAMAMSPINVFVSRVMFFLLSSVTRLNYSPSRSTDRASRLSKLEQPQTTLVALLVSTLVPQTTLKPLRTDLPHTTAVPQTTQFPAPSVPQ